MKCKITCFTNILCVKYLYLNLFTSDCEKYIQEIVTIVEEWLYSGPLKFHFYPNISHGITAAFSIFCLKKESRMGRSKWKSNATMPSFINILELVAGSDVRNYFGEL